MKFKEILDLLIDPERTGWIGVKKTNKFFKYENIYLGIHIGDKAIIDMSLVPHGVRECYCHFEKTGFTLKIIYTFEADLEYDHRILSKLNIFCFDGVGGQQAIIPDLDTEQAPIEFKKALIELLNTDKKIREYILNHTDFHPKKACTN